MPKQKFDLKTDSQLDQEETIELIDGEDSNLKQTSSTKRTSKKRKTNILKSILKTSKSRLGGRSIIKLPRPSSLTRRKSSIITSANTKKKNTNTPKSMSKCSTQQSPQNRRSSKCKRKNVKRNLRNVKSRDLTHLHLLVESNFRPKTDVVYSSLIFRHIPFNWINEEDNDGCVDTIKFNESDLEDSLVSYDNCSPTVSAKSSRSIDNNNNNNDDSLEFITLESIQNEFNNVYRNDIFNANFKPNNNKNYSDNDD
ncbi:uncharacterized protein LOC113798597 [Dermatophagoides pteronyssinus]|uniref:uncharacterized protein LOC113798597 n=1 Tax=Dermatophagoides pteronyssinus TaxID=6956 RepID=UPI003F66D890